MDIVFYVFAVIGIFAVVGGGARWAYISDKKSDEAHNGEYPRWYLDELVMADYTTRYALVEEYARGKILTDKTFTTGLEAEEALKRKRGEQVFRRRRVAR